MKISAATAGIAAVFISLAAWAQDSVTIGGTINVMYENVRANGATAGRSANILPYDRIVDGFGSNIRFTVIEDLGGGNSAFVQVESAVVGNADQNSNALGRSSGICPIGNCTAIWGNRNSGVGIRSQTAGRFLIGLWDAHYDMQYFAEGWLRPVSTSAQSSALALTQNFGAASNINPYIGQRYSNVLRWDSPTWSGVSMTAVYARPSDQAPPNVPGSVLDGRNNRMWNFTPRFESGPFRLGYSYLSDKDAVTSTPIVYAGVPLAGGATIPAAWKIESNRVAARYRLDNGIWIGAIWDGSSMSNTTSVTRGQVGIKRSVWALPLSYAAGNHMIAATYAKASNWSGSIGGADLHAFTSRGFNLGSDTGARFASFVYSYTLSQRTAVFASYQKITNQPLAGYDFFTVAANYSLTGIGFASYGADPKSIAVGIRHNF